MALLVLLNNFFHDFSAAGWLVGTVMLWIVLRHARPAASDQRQLVCELLRVLLVFMWVSLFGIVVLGGVRTLAYRRYEWSAAAGDAQVPLLVWKHVFFTVLFVPGIVFIVRASRFLRGARGQVVQSNESGKPEDETESQSGEHRYRQL